MHCYALGTPDNLPVTIVNQDVGIAMPITSYNLSISEAFISGLDKDVMNINYSQSVEEAKNLVKAGESWAVFHFRANYSKDTVMR